MMSSCLKKICADPIMSVTETTIQLRLHSAEHNHKIAAYEMKQWSSISNKIIILALTEFWVKLPHWTT